jgi:hypothetical protein
MTTSTLWVLGLSAAFGCMIEPEPSHAPEDVADLADIAVSYQLDPRLTRASYMGSRWVSPPTYVRVGGGEEGVQIEMAVSGLSGSGVDVEIRPEIESSDPDLLSASRSDRTTAGASPQANHYTARMRGPGTASLRLSSGGRTRVLEFVGEKTRSGGLQVSVTQDARGPF